MTRLRILSLIPLVFLTACSHPAPTATVELIDTSLSVGPRAEQSALAAVRGQISRLGRGDTLILIPITGDAENDAGGRILRMQAPTTREPYDAGLRRFHKHALKQFAVWVTSMHAQPNRTDILGALDVARQELASVPNGSIRRLVVVSDFLEDDGQYNFVFEPALRSAFRAARFASRLRTVHSFVLQGSAICLGRLASLDFARLSPERKEAVDAFWRAYLAVGGRTPDIEIDGIGMVTGADGDCFNRSSAKRRKQGNAP